MHIRIRVIIESDKGAPELVQDVAHLERQELRPETLGLTLAEAKALLASVRRAMSRSRPRSLCPEGDMYAVRQAAPS
jgi:hypothetical protein